MPLWTVYCNGRLEGMLQQSPNDISLGQFLSLLVHGIIMEFQTCSVRFLKSSIVNEKHECSTTQRDCVRSVRSAVTFSPGLRRPPPTVGDSRLTRRGTTHAPDLSRRGAARAEDAQDTPTQSHVSPSTLVYEDNQGRALGTAAKGLT